MDRRVLRERMRRKQRQIRRRRIIKLVTYVVAMVLAVIFVIRGVIFPIVSRVGGKSTGKSQSVQADAGDGVIIRWKHSFWRKDWLTGIQPDQRKRQQTMEFLQGAQLLTVRSSARFFQKAAATQWTISIM